MSPVPTSTPCPLTLRGRDHLSTGTTQNSAVDYATARLDAFPIRSIADVWTKADELRLSVLMGLRLEFRYNNRKNPNIFGTAIGHW
jgi:hypothetical protein